MTSSVVQGRARLIALVTATVVVSAVALAMMIFYAPTDRVQGVVQRIFYFHVPMAWVAYLAFFVVLVCSVGYLWRRDLRWDAMARASAEIGVLFTTLVLITGSLWAKPIWNTWWTWDARLTSTLVLWFIYVAYLMLRAYTPDLERAARFSAVLGIVGFIDVPIIHFSVEWWRTLHPEPVVVRPDPQAPPEMLVTLAVSLVAMTLVYATFLVLRTALERTRDENREREQRRALEEASYA
ncbi:MAG: cytochrome C assembly protein [Chloroflexi bacterium]|nr:cytochrome C assembly protein [Chloroflexota bacterium]